MITIFPVLSISMRAICTPAAVTALTALVTSCCRNVDGARAMHSYRKAFLSGSDRGQQPKAFVAAPGPSQESLPSAGKRRLCSRKAKKVEKVLGVMTGIHFLPFLAFLALVPR